LGEREADVPPLTLLLVTQLGEKVEKIFLSFSLSRLLSKASMAISTNEIRGLSALRRFSPTPLSPSKNLSDPR